MLRVVPPDQRLDACDPLAVQTDLRLIVKLQLIVRQGLPKRSFKGLSLLQLDVHILFEKTIDASAIGFGAVESQIGVAQQMIGISLVFRVESDADATADNDLVTLKVEGLGKGVNNPLRQASCAIRLTELALNDREFVAAQPRQGITCANETLEPSGHLPEKLVAEFMSEGIVDIFEVVEIEQQ